MTIAWVALFAGLAVLITIVLFASGVLYARPVVTRMQQAHDAETERLRRDSQSQLAREREDCDYYRRAAQSCAAAIAHLEGQNRTMRVLLEQHGNGVGDERS